MTTFDTPFEAQSHRELFPYGTFPLEERVREEYGQTGLSSSCPLPEVLPLHHPVFQQLEGIVPVCDTLPPWWADFVAQADPRLQPLLARISIREFRTGCISEYHWRTWRTEVSDRTGLPRSPKLGPMLQDTVWDDFFVDRGDKETPEKLNLVISTRPEFFLNMSNGDGWTSCQHLYYGGDNAHLPANLYDLGVAVAMLIPRDVDIWHGGDERNRGVVLARTTLRRLLTPQGTQVIAIGRSYGNNLTSELHLLSHLIGAFEQRRLSWGILDYYGLVSRMTRGAMGSQYQGHPCDVILMESEPFALPSSWRHPYIDGTADFTDQEDDEEMRSSVLSAEVIPFFEA